ncbi:MAG: PorV/PorQ family protein [Elusimicrobiota bacterium]
MNKTLKNIIRKNFLAVIVFSQVLSAHAGGSFGQSSDIFNVGAGARSMAMGGAFTGLADDGSASYFNPAGLAYLDEHQLLAMHAPLFIDTHYNYLSSAHPFGDKWGSVAVSDSLLLSDGFQVRDAFNNVTDKNGELRNNVIFTSYARKIRPKLSIGANIKLIQQKVAGFSDGAFGLDLGVLYKFHPLLNVGASIGNVNSPEVKLRNEADVFKPITKFGVASEVLKNRLMLTGDYIKLSNQDNLYAVGAEYKLHKFVDLRTGFNANKSFTMGIGLNLKQFHVDYAFSDTDIGAFNKVSFTWAYHNIYKTNIEPPIKEGKAVYPLSGFENQIAFKTTVPQHTVISKWSLLIKDAEGKDVRTLEGDLDAPNPIIWDGKNQMGEPVVDGEYNYAFLVTYKNGKSWSIPGDLLLTLPQRQNEEIIDMNLRLNGAQSSEAIPVNNSNSPQIVPVPETAPQTEEIK